MRIAQKTAVFLGAALLSPGAVLAQADNQPTMVGGVETVCTGTTTDVREDPKWQAYSLRLEFAGKDGQYLGDEQFNVSGNGQSISVHCNGPWVLMKLPPGTYKVTADVADAGHKDVTVRVPGRVIVRFPNAGGEVDEASKTAVR